MRVLAACLSLLAVLASSTAQAQVDKLGGYEKQALKTALERRHLELDPNPEGKVLERIHVVNLDVFSETEGFLQFFNIFHFTTKEHVIAREVVIRPGQVWDADLVAETKRRLNISLFTTLVVTVPVKAQTEGKVDLLVVTRDIWSLRMNSQFEVQERVLTRLSLSLSENNVFGYRKQAAVVFDMNLGQYSIGPQYIDTNIAGSRLQLSTRVSALFSRANSDFEGTSSSLALVYPLWSLQSEWGASLSLSHFDSTVRQFLGTSPRTFDNPETLEIEAIPRIFDFRSSAVRTSVVRSLGTKFKHRITAGHSLSVRRPSVRDDFGAEGISQPTRERVEIARDAFIRGVLPRSERVSAVFVNYTFFIPKFIVYRNVDTYDLPEDARLGPDFSAELSNALELIGSEENFVRVSSSAGWTFDFAQDGFVRTAVSGGGRIQGGDFFDGSIGASVRAASPMFERIFRVVGRVAYAQLIDDTNNNFLSVGGDNGLRGFAINEFSGQKRVRANLELRSAPVPFLFTRLGGLAFYDVGHAADTVDQLSLQHDVGVGFRAIVPQLQPIVFRFDYAFPLTGPNALLPGRFSAGIAQAF